MSACGRRQAGISQQTQSLLAIAVPPLLMKPSLTNADECLLVNTVERQGMGGGGDWRGGLSSSLLLSVPAALRKMCVAALTQFAVYCRWHARGDEAVLERDEANLSKKLLWCYCIVLQSSWSDCDVFLRALCSVSFVPSYKKIRSW